MASSIVGGTGWEPTPWHATQRAALEAMMRDELPEEDDPKFKRLSRRTWRGAFPFGIISDAVLCVAASDAVICHTP